ncbi:MAG: CARDB domain-containing protein, partial [Myxococcota bacterium]|nr:CARDB domain-containing protein [Myxococcota bacterium]
MRRTAMMILGLVLAATSAMAAPDLSCTILVEQVTDVSGPEPVKKVQVTVSVTNLGDSGATNTGNVDPILVFRDLPDAPTPSDVPDAFFPLTSLAPGAEVNFDLEEVSMVPGSYKAWCWVNPVIPGDEPPIADEVNFEDNIVSKPYIVTPPPIAAPDLVITSLETTPVGPYEYDFSVVVDNVGGAASGPFQVDIFPDEEAEPNWSTPGLFSEVFCASDGLSAQSSEVLSCTPIYTGWTPLDVGTQTVYAYVDIGGEVGDESDISNNSFSTDVEVKAPAELSTLFFAVDSEAGDVTYDVTVGNAGGENATGVSVGLVYQSTFPPNSCDDADDVKVVPFIQAAGSTLVQFERTGAIGGEGFNAWVIVDCDDTVLEGGEGDNVASFTYDVDGVPNAPPEFGEIEAPPDCRETEACYWNVEVIDETIAGADVAIRVVDGPAGMWGDSANQRIVYVPPLGSTAVNTDFTVVLDDGLGGTAEQVLQVDVEPRTDFRGLVGQKGALPTDVGNQCALFEIPGTGFLWVDREDYAVRLVRSEEGDQTPLSDVSPHLTIPVAIDHNVESPFLSCHVALAPNGGFFLLETTTQVLLQYGADGTFIRKIAVEGVSSGVEVFVPFAESTYVFFDTIQDFPFPALYFIDVRTGTLDTDYGAPLEDAEEGDPKSGKIPLAIVTPADWSSEYLWIGPDRIRLLNRQFSALGFVDLSFTGEVIAETLFEDTPIDGIVPTDPELYLPMAAPDGGLMLQDFSTATLRWYQADYSPRYGFSLAAPGGDTEPGVVSLQAYGYSVDNIRCDLLPAGGWTCHDFTSQRGFVVDEFGDLYDYCPKVSVSPTSIEFGGITAFETSEKTVTVVNAGSGVFAVESVSLSEVFGEFSAITPAAFPTSPYLLAPGSAIALDFEYTPTGPGEAGLIFNINAVADDPLCPASKISIPVTGYSGARLQATPGLISFNGVGPGLHTQKVTIQSVGS